MNGRDLRALFDSHLTAFNHQDLDTLLAGFAADAVWVTGTDVFRGHAQLADLFGGAFALAPTLRAATVLIDGDRVAAELTEHLVHQGKESLFAIAGFYRFSGERIAAAKIYREGSATLPR